MASNRRISVGKGWRRVDELTGDLPAWSWQRLSAGVGAHGPRMYSWAWLKIPSDTACRWVLVRRNDSSGELAYYLTYSPNPVPLRTLVRVAGQRWRVEESFQTGKGLTGLDEHQVRRWKSWHRWVTLAMLAHAFLTVITAVERDTVPTPDGLIPITVNEQRRLVDALILRPHRSLERLLHWSAWRRRHQARARQCHYRRRDESP